MESFWDAIYDTFLASVRSVGTACTLAAVGTYMHQRGVISVQGKRMLALISQQVTFPLFLFTKIIYCNQDYSAEACPSVTESLRQVWILLFWPLFVVPMGMLVGWIVSVTCKTNVAHRKSVMAAIAFGNSTGLPITLLTVVHSTFAKTSELGRVDPTLFLSVYLLLYPVLQWGLGGWLLAPSKEDEDENENQDAKESDIEQQKQEDETTKQSDVSSLASPPLTSIITQPLLTTQGQFLTPTASADGNTQRMHSIQSTLKINILNNAAVNEQYARHHQGLYSSDEGLYLSDFNLASLGQQHGDGQLGVHTAYQQALLASPSAVRQPHASGLADGQGDEHMFPPIARTNSSASHEFMLYDSPDATQACSSQGSSGGDPEPPATEEQQPLLVPTGDINANSYGAAESATQVVADKELEPIAEPKTEQSPKEPTRSEYKGDSIWVTLKNIADKSFQPPVIGALVGILVAISPARGLFVDTVDRDADAPLEWLFDGLFSVGLTAVPINMIILGCNLSSSYNKFVASRNNEVDDGAAAASKKDTGVLNMATMIGIVLGKMIVMPTIGFLAAVILQTFFLDIPGDIDSAFYLVLLIVFLTPTANNVMVMVELSGSNTKEAIASVIAMQYAVAPVILSGTMTIAIGYARSFDSN